MLNCSEVQPATACLLPLLHGTLKVLYHVMVYVMCGCELQGATWAICLVQSATAVPSSLPCRLWLPAAPCGCLLLPCLHLQVESLPAGVQQYTRRCLVQGLFMSLLRLVAQKL